MANKITQLVNESGDNLYPLAGGMAADSIGTEMLKDGSVTSDKIDSATLDLSAITPAQGYSIVNLVISKKGGVVYFNGSIGIPQITSIDNQTSVFTIPAGWRPVSAMNFVVVSFNGASPVPLARVRITADGTLKISKIDQDLTASSYVQVASVSYVAN